MDPKQAARPIPKRSLVTDEIVELPSQIWLNTAYRMRAWRGMDATPIVLVSPTTNALGLYSKPHAMSTQLARYSLAAVGYPQSSIIYFEAEYIPNSEQALYSVHFSFFGPATRLRLHNPTYNSYDWRTLETIVGEPIER